MPDPGQTLWLVILQNVVLGGVVVAAFLAGVLGMRLAGRRASFSLAPLGFSKPNDGLFVGVAIGFSVGIGALILGTVVNAVSVVILDALGYSTESRVQQPFMRALSGWVGDNPALAIPAIIFTVVFFGPFVEELVFRGAVFNGLFRLGGFLFGRLGGGDDGKRGGVAGWASFALAAVLSSGFFALLHLEPVILPALLLLAVALCWLFWRTGSLLPPFVAHATFNSFATLLVILGGLGVFPMPV